MLLLAPQCGAIRQGDLACEATGLSAWKVRPDYRCRWLFREWHGRLRQQHKRHGNTWRKLRRQGGRHLGRQLFRWAGRARPQFWQRRRIWHQRRMLSAYMARATITTQSKVKSLNSVALYGESTNSAGVYGLSSTHHGVIGRTLDPTKYAILADGKVAITGGTDIAERFSSAISQTIEPGTVVVVDEAHPGQINPSDAAYARTVVGIVSGAGGVEPGLVLHQKGMMEGPHIVAIAGRVYVKATATNGAIKPGDLLTTADLPGHAMKATDRDLAFGAIIGKALTGLDNGAGMVLVLVNLQ